MAVALFGKTVGDIAVVNGKEWEIVKLWDLSLFPSPRSRGEGGRRPDEGRRVGLIILGRGRLADAQFGWVAAAPHPPAGTFSP